MNFLYSIGSSGHVIKRRHLKKIIFGVKIAGNNSIGYLIKRNSKNASIVVINLFKALRIAVRWKFKKGNDESSFEFNSYVNHVHSRHVRVILIQKSPKGPRITVKKDKCQYIEIDSLRI